MGQDDQQQKLLTSKELKSRVQDKERPSLLIFLVLETLEWCVLIGVILLVVNFSRGLWQPLIDYFYSK